MIAIEAQKKILIVEDEGLVALDIEDRTKGLGYDVVGIASTGAEAVDLAEKYSPDLIIMDVTLKGKIDGIEAARQIKKIINPCLIFMTAHSDQNTLERINNVKPQGFITKPLNTSSLQSVIEKALLKDKM
jgi:CheY-like chemotaxis protein